MKKYWWIALILVLALAIPAVASQAVKVYVNGQELKTDVPAQIVDGRTLVPIRAVAESLGKTVEWNNDSKTVTITGKSDLEKVNAIFADMAVSPHQALQANTDREACAKCHDGNGFENQNNPDYQWVEGQKTGLACESCHTGPGGELIASGEVELPFMKEAYQAGAGAVCLDCHNGRRDPVELAKAVNEEGFRTGMGYPHYGAANILTGKGGMPIEGVTYATSFAHPNLENSCVSCHMPKVEDGYKSHDFNMDVAYVDQTCGSCHAGIDTFDYRGFQTEVYKMNNKLKQAAIDAVPGAVNVESGSGRLQFKDAEGKEIPMGQVSHEAYVAAYNWYTVYGDKSKGIHNPRYTKSLIQESYKYVTGQEMQ